MFRDECINSVVNSLIRVRNGVIFVSFREDENGVCRRNGACVETSASKLHCVATQAPRADMKLDCTLSNNFDRDFR